MIKLDIPFYSQFTNVAQEEWKERACAPTCLKMVLDFLSGGKFEKGIDDLIKEGLVIVGGYEPGNGWTHAGIIRLAHNHGFQAYLEEFRTIKVNVEEKTFSKSDFEDLLIEKGIEKIKNTLGSGLPVIISCSKNFDEFHKFHQVVLIGFDDNGFYYHEPHKESEEEGANRFVDFQTFKTHWRKFAIFLNK